MSDQGARPSPWELTRRLLSNVRDHRGVALAAMASILVASLAGAGPIAVAKATVGVLFPADDEDGPSWITERTLEYASSIGASFGFVPDDPRLAAIPFLVAIILILGLISGAANFGAHYFGRMLSAHVVTDLRCALMRKTLELPLSRLTKAKAGDLLSRFATDVQSTYAGLNAFLLTFLFRSVVLFFAIAAAFLLNWRLALSALFVLPILVVPVLRIGAKANRHSRRSLVSLGESTEALTQSLSGMRVIKAFGAEQSALDKYRELNDTWLGRQRKLIRAVSTGRGLMQLVYAVSLAVVLGLGGALVITGRWDMDHETFTAFLVALAATYNPLKLVTKSYHTWQSAMAAAGRVFEVLETPLSERGGQQEIGPIKEAIVLDKVSFSYRDDGDFGAESADEVADLAASSDLEEGPEEGETKVLDGVSFRIPAGRSLALVGPSGSGKSTITDLIFRFLEPDSGQILVDGRPIAEIEPSSLLDQIAIVSQHPFLFNASLRENILYGRPDATQEEIEDAARAAQIHTRIQELPEGYDTVVGERGASLSGGELQRVTIARAILKRASFLLLDEATSSLDPVSERAVQEALGKELQGTTTLIIAHRLSTIIDVDHIVVISKGRVMEQGTHAELLAADGVYAGLYRAQESEDS
jgi:ATP-binding cassette, subfamily B, bacterial MsbA